MKKYFVIGNPIEHSLSPLLHNHWIKKNNINANYDKKLLKKDDLSKLILDLKENKIQGLNITVPFKKEIIPFLDNLTEAANISKSVNTIYKSKNEIVGHNTDIIGFQRSMDSSGETLKNKKVFIIGAGGVVSSIVIALKKMKVSKIYLSNRTNLKSLNLKKIYQEIEVIEWGKIVDFDIIVNATSFGLKENETIDLDYENISKNKFFYDVIYNPKQTNFLKRAKEFGAKIENGKMMFIYQAQEAFYVWHKILPKIDKETLKLFEE
jgi:shikimate dehydrogenase